MRPVPLVVALWLVGSALCVAQEKKCSTLAELELPYVTHLVERPAAHTPMSTTFISTLEYALDRYWDDGTPQGMYQGRLEPQESTAVGTYAGHVFFFRRPGRNQRVVSRYTMEASESLYLVMGEEDPAEMAKRDPRFKQLLTQQQWMRAYHERTGVPWLGHYDLATGARGLPRLPMWEAKHLGQQHHVRSAAGHWAGEEQSQGTDGLDLALKVVSLAPRVLLVPELLSKAECELIVDMARSRVRESTIGNGAHSYKDQTRTSKTTWLERTAHPALDAMFTRFADVLQLDDVALGPQGSPRIGESLQVVHYSAGQEYRPHYDFFNTPGSNATRFLTLLFYLNADNGVARGGTSFPKAFEGRGLQVRPPQGSAVLFYSMLPDGNSDMLSEHAGLPVPEGQGEKWVANLWVWDPQRPQAIGR